MLFGKLFLVGASAAALTATAAQLEDAQDAAALALDDECAAEDEQCTLNAVQLRTQRHSTEAHKANRTRGEMGNATCYAYTGGTCLTEGCKPMRHATCDNSSRCVCASGCSGADGVCYNRTNELIVGDFVLRNVKYSNYKMYFQRMSIFGQIKTTALPTYLNGDQDKFDLYAVPGANGTMKGYMMSSSKWKEQVFAIRPTAATALSPFGGFAVNIEADHVVPWNPTDIMLQLCAVTTPGYEGSVQIGSLGSITKWAYLHHGSWFLYASLSAPGSGGYWRPEPLFKEGMFPPCEEAK